MKSKTPEYFFLKRGTEQFQQDLLAINKIITNKIFSEDELLEIMVNLVAIKENIESLEAFYLKNAS